MIIAAIIILCILSALSVLQLALALGAPLGRFAWGGRHEVLPTRLRIGSAVSITIYGFFAMLILTKAEIVPIIDNGKFLHIGLWAVTIYLAASIPLNAVSRSKTERYTMTPAVTMLAVCFVVVALG